MNSVDDVANALGITARRVQQLTAEGIFPKNEKEGEYNLFACIRAYIDYKIGLELKNKQKTTNGLIKEDEQARYAAAQADKIEFELSIKREEYLKAAEIQKLIENAVSNCRSKLLAIPKKTAIQLVGISKPAEIEQVIKKFIYEGLNELVIPNFDERTSENPENNM